jgi:HSP20 family protein
MAIVKWDPFPELRAMQEQMNRLLEMSRDRAEGEPLEAGLWQPPVDIYEDDQEVVVKMEIPEVDQEDVEVQIEGYTLIIQGVRRLEREEKRQNYQRIERCYGKFRRVFSLPAEVDADRTCARCDRGVLQVVMPKKEPAQSRQIEIEIR